MKIISGGQTGVDQAGLYAAKNVGFPTGGYMPKGFKTQEGNKPEFALKFGIRETNTKSYVKRTELNVKESDGTLRIASNYNSPGEILNLKFIIKHKKPSLSLNLFNIKEENTIKLLIKWVKMNNIKVLNIAGNSEKTSPGIFENSKVFLENAFRIIKEGSNETQLND